MGRSKSKTSDKMYISQTEWSQGQGGRGSGRAESAAVHARLPFDCCAISLRPAENPLCTRSGVVFDLESIVPWLKKFGTDPTTGQKLELKDLVKITFHRNAEGTIHCPVTFKVFNEHSHIVAIATSGNVYSFEAVKELNLSIKSFKDLLTGEDFTRKDIITLQDPHDVESRDITKFHHVRNEQSLDEEQPEDPLAGINVDNVGATARAALKSSAAASAKAPPTPTAAGASNGSAAKTAAETEFTGFRLPSRAVVKKVRGAAAASAAAAKTTPAAPKAAAGKATPKAPAKAHYSTGRVAASFTSTAMDVHVENELADLPVGRVRAVKKKAYVSLKTSLGDINLELHSDTVPVTCNNFLRLCEAGKYDNTIFHRSIKNFMIQGGDPTGTGTGGESIYGEPFEDEFRSNLTHSGRGILSMANSGPKTNTSQFFILYRSAPHLDRKHTVFGHVVGGLTTLTAMEKVKTDAKDRPVEEIRLVSTTVFVNPFDEAEEAPPPVVETVEDPDKDMRGAWFSNPTAVTMKATGTGIGKYLPLDESSVKRSATAADGGDDDIDSLPMPKRAKPNKPAGAMSDFSAW